MDTDEPILGEENADGASSVPFSEFLDASFWNQWEYVIAGFLCVVILGAALGITRKIVVFENYNDLFLTFATALIPTLLYSFSFASGLPIDGPIAMVAWALSAAALLYVIYCTFKSNSGIFSAVLALITKLPLGIFFIFMLLDFITPSGKSAANRAESRRTGFIALLLLSPVIYKLVETHEGFINLKRYTGRFGS